MRTSKWLWLGLTVALCVGCDSPSGDVDAAVNDAGASEDSGADSDAGSGADAGDSDAGSGTDAGVDTDAGVRSDAGSAMDAGVLVDAGPTPMDAGPVPSDSGPPDAGQPDAGPSFRLVSRHEQTVPADGVSSWRFEVERSGAVGDITITLVGLPAGVTSTPVLVGPAETFGTLTVAGSGADVGGPFVATARGQAAGVADFDVDLGVFVTGTSGTADTSLGGSGHVSLATETPGEVIVRSLRVRRAGPAAVISGALVCGITSEPGARHGFVAAVGRDGTLDTTWAGDGVLTEANDTSCRDVVDLGGRIVVAYHDLAIGRAFYRSYLPDGTSDPAFTGAATMPSPSLEQVIALYGHGSGYVSFTQGSIRRFDRSGDRDTSFGSNGILFHGLAQGVRRVQQDASRHYYLAMYAAPTDTHFRVARLDPSLALDSTYGAGGIASLAVPSGISATPVRVSDVAVYSEFVADRVGVVTRYVTPSGTFSELRLLDQSGVEILPGSYNTLSDATEFAATLASNVWLTFGQSAGAAGPHSLLKIQYADHGIVPSFLPPPIAGFDPARSGGLRTEWMGRVWIAGQDPSDATRFSVWRFWH